jgi:hypothetical protein
MRSHALESVALTIHQKSASGTPLAEARTARGILAGIKVDAGAKPLAGSPHETVTEGLDGLRERLKEYHGLGTGFAKWRAVIRITDTLPTQPAWAPMRTRRRGTLPPCLASCSCRAANKRPWRPRILTQSTGSRARSHGRSASPTGASGSAAGGVAWAGRKPGSWPANFRPPRSLKYGGECRELHGRDASGVAQH